MSSMISIGVSFLLFFVILGFMWLVGTNIIAAVALSLPDLPPGPWADLKEDITFEVKMIISFTPAVLFLFGAIKMLLSAANQGRD